MGSERGYPNIIRQKAIKDYLEGMGFRRIGRLKNVRHVFL